MRRLMTCVVLWASAALAEGERLKVLVLPAPAVSAEVPVGASAKAQGLLVGELKTGQSLTVVDAPGRPTDGAALTAARAAFEEGKRHWEAHALRPAGEALSRSLAGYRTASAQLTDPGEVADAWALMAAVSYQAGRDDEGAANLAQALALAPERPVYLTQSSPLFAGVVGQARAKVKALARGSLLVESTPARVPARLDGLAVGVTPVLVHDLPLGEHLVSAQLPDGEAVGAAVEVPTQGTGHARLAASDGAALFGALSRNTVDASALAALKDLAVKAGADLVLFGVLSRDDQGLAFDAVVYGAKAGAVRRLGRAKFDVELLNASSQLFALVGELGRGREAAGEPMKLPATLAPGRGTEMPRAAEVNYARVGGRDVATDALGEPEPTVAAPTPDPATPAAPKRRVPLRKP